jgi:hypothetical protein
MERFSLDFELTDGVGWAHAKVMVGQATHETAVSYLTADPLGSFANALMALSACARCIENLAVKHGVVGYRLKWHDGDLPLSQYLLLRRWLKSPRINPTRVERGTWREDVAELQLLGA